VSLQLGEGDRREAGVEVVMQGGSRPRLAGDQAGELFGIAEQELDLETGLIVSNSRSTRNFCKISLFFPKIVEIICCSITMERELLVIVEVFGFTDGVPIRNTTGCTMDNRLVAFNQNGKAPSPCSNVELGKLRADTVAKQIRSELASGDLIGVRVLGYSAGQTVLPNKTLATVADDGKNAPERRFVEVRFNIIQ
jgi:hypothetical protein